MPNVWTHILYGEKVAKAVGFEDFLRDFKPFYQLGTQGPDPFFYHNFFPWQSKPVGIIGNKLHYEKCGIFLSELIQYGYQHNDPKLRAYIAGFVTHHLLDRNTHPYINYRSGNEGNRHQRLEIIIDTLLMKRWRKRETYKLQVHKELYVGRALYEPIRHMLTALIEKVFTSEARDMPADYVNKSYQHMMRALQILHDPYGWKNLLLKEHIAPFSYQKHVDDKDYLNETNTKWLHPTNDQEESEESFLTLFEKAEREGNLILSLLQEYWHTGEKQLLAQIEESIGNISYDTGKDCTLGLENKFFNPIL
ncbi:zinc dependent phospholipase C family protein [Bacillus sp. BGMRC 2118]|nr:zinc dependent phospholipase C family protein [Bacillus sp. BGMRC 2118]